MGHSAFVLVSIQLLSCRVWVGRTAHVPYKYDRNEPFVTLVGYGGMQQAPTRCYARPLQMLSCKGKLPGARLDLKPYLAARAHNLLKRFSGADTRRKS